MKKIINIFVMLSIMISFTNCMTMYTVVDDNLTRVKVIKTQNLTDNQLYVKANLWLVDVFNDARSVIHFKDKEAGVVKGKYLLTSYRSSTVYIPSYELYTTITIQISEGIVKMKLVTSPFSEYKLTKENFNIKMDELISQFKSEFQ